MIMKASTRKTATVPTRPRRKKSGDLVKGVNDILIFELDIEHDEDLKPDALLESFPGYDQEWTIAYLTALLEEEFTIELVDEEMAKLKTVEDVHNIIRRYLTK
jgi:hypothetical protein